MKKAALVVVLTVFMISCKSKAVIVAASNEPVAPANYLSAKKIIENYLKESPNKLIKIIPQIRCEDQEHLEKYLQELINKKAEGIIIKNPNIDYFSERSNEILKVKKFEDDEGKVIGHNYKDKKFKSLKIKLENGVVFNLGGGFSDKERLNPPKVGDIVTFKYYGFTKNDKSKFASFLRVRKEE